MGLCPVDSVRYNLFHICIDLHVLSGELPTSPSRFIFLFGHCSAPLEQLGDVAAGSRTPQQQKRAEHVSHLLF